MKLLIAFLALTNVFVVTAKAEEGPWKVVTSTDGYMQYPVITYPSPYNAFIPMLACPDTKEHCLWVQDFVDAMNFANGLRNNKLEGTIKSDIRMVPATGIEKCLQQDGCSWTDSYGCQCMSWERKNKEKK